MPTPDMVNALLFEEEDIKEFGKIGECVLDNWSIEAIVCRRGHKIEPDAEQLAKRYNVPLLDSTDLGKKK